MCSVAVSRDRRFDLQCCVDRRFFDDVRFNVMALLDRPGGVLSGGEQQQLAIARALLSMPKLLLLDEPTEGIQPSIIDQIEEVIIGFKAQRRFAILLVEQGIQFAARLADSYVIMAKGAVVATGQAIKNHAAFIWSVADLLRGDYKQSEYGKVILPLTVLRRLDCVLEPTKQKVLDRATQLAGKVDNLDPILENWARRGKPDPYESGTWGPASADKMLARDGRTWRRP